MLFQCRIRNGCDAVHYVQLLHYDSGQPKCRLSRMGRGRFAPIAEDLQAQQNAGLVTSPSDQSKSLSAFQESYGCARKKKAIS
jgi:hypothetical protein